jgi:hypothetical protein
MSYLQNQQSYSYVKNMRFLCSTLYQCQRLPLLRCKTCLCSSILSLWTGFKISKEEEGWYSFNRRNVMFREYEICMVCQTRDGDGNINLFKPLVLCIKWLPSMNKLCLRSQFWNKMTNGTFHFNKIPSASCSSSFQDSTESYDVTTLQCHFVNC